MAQVEIPGGFYIPEPFVTATPPTMNFLSNGFLSGTNPQRVAFLFQVPKSGTLDKCELMCNFVNAPSDVKISFQDNDNATGLPDGTADQFRVLTGVTAVWQVPGLMTSDGTDGGTKRTVTKGDLLWIVTEWNTTQSGEVDWCGVGNNGNSGYYGNGMSYFASHNGTSYTKRSWGSFLSLVLKYNDGSYVCPDYMTTVVSTATQTYASNSTPDERSLYFSFPGPVTVDGGWAMIDCDAAMDIVLYDSDGTSVLQSLSLDSDNREQTAAAPFFFRFPAGVALTAGSNYRLSFKPTTTTSISIYQATVNSAALMGGWTPGAGWQLSTRTDAGAWSQTTTIRPWAGVHVTHTEGASAGTGGVSRSRVQRGM